MLQKGIVIIVATIYSILVASTFFMLPIYFKQDLGFSTSQIGIILAAMSITALLSMIPSGISNDLFTSRRLAKISLLVLIITLMLLSIVRGFIALIITMILHGASRELFRLSLETFIFRSEEIYKMPITLGNYHGSRMIGLFIGMVVASFVLEKVDFSNFLLIISLCIVIPFLLLRFMPDTQLSSEYNAGEYKREILKPSVIIFMVFIFVFTTHWGAEYVNYGIYLTIGLNLTNSQAALYMSVEFLLIGVAVPLFAHYYHKFNILISSSIALVLSGIGHIFMVNNRLFLSLIFRGLHGIGDGLLMIISYMIIAQNFSKERIGGLNAVINFIMMLGMLIGSVLYGLIGDIYGNGTSLIISGIATISSIPFIAIWYKLKK